MYTSGTLVVCSYDKFELTYVVREYTNGLRCYRSGGLALSLMGNDRSVYVVVGIYAHVPMAYSTGKQIRLRKMVIPALRYR